MIIDTSRIITVTEANQNFSRATRIADEHGEAIIFKNNRPKYKIINLDVEPDLELTDDEKIDVVARRVMERFKPAFMELAK
jgi:antitoxin Phd